MYPILLETNYFIIKTYGVIMFLAFLLGYLIIKKNFIRFGLGHPAERFSTITISILIFSRVIGSPEAIHQISNNKFNFFGGIIGYIIGIIITRYKDSIGKLLDISSSTIVILYIFSSIGHVMDNSHFYGTESTAKWPLAITIEQVNFSEVGASVWAISYFAILGSIIIYFINKRKYHIPGIKFTTTLFYLSLLGYGLEHIRGDSTDLIKITTLSCIIISIILYIYFKISYKKERKNDINYI